MNYPTALFEHEILDSPFFEENNTVDEVIEAIINSEVTKSQGDDDKRSFDLSYFDNEGNEEIEKANFDLNHITVARNQFKKGYTKQSQKWIGHVVEIQDDHFIAKLEDLSAGGTNELAEFDMVEISNDDIELFGLGAIFYWSVSFVFDKGQIEKKELLRFQRVSPLTLEECDSFADKARELSNSSSWDE